jgi:hypothetical protein
MSDFGGAFQMAVTTLTGAINVVKLLKEANTRFVEAEYKSKLADVYTGLSDAKMHVADLEVLLSEKDQTIRELKEQLTIKATIVWEEPHYWTLDSDKKDGPFCQTCWDRDKKLIRIQVMGASWRCNTCNSREDHIRMV